MIGLLTAVYGLGWVPTIVWVLLAWCGAAVVVGLVVARVVRLRDMQVVSSPGVTRLRAAGGFESSSGSGVVP